MQNVMITTITMPYHILIFFVVNSITLDHRYLLIHHFFEKYLAVADQRYHPGYGPGLSFRVFSTMSPTPIMTQEHKEPSKFITNC